MQKINMKVSPEAFKAESTDLVLLASGHKEGVDFYYNNFINGAF